MARTDRRRRVKATVEWHFRGNDREIRMRERNGGSGRLWLLVALGALVLLVSALAAGCGGDDEEEAVVTELAVDTGAAPAEPAPAETTGAGEPINIGVLSTCEGPFDGAYEATLAGALAVYIQHGATANGPKPSDGITWEVGGHPVEIVNGCSDVTADKALEEARRLVEQEGVQILQGPFSGSEGIVANYCTERADVTFLNGTSAAQETTLKVHCPNFYRFHTDGAQWMAGLGDYAYNTLGWRKMVTFADDYDFAYTQTAGFVAEFCALGGEVITRIWPPLGEEDYTSYIAQIPEDVDGLYVAVGGTGTLAFVKQYTQLTGDLADKIVGGSLAIDPTVLTDPDVGPRVVGVVAGGSTDEDSTTPEYAEYVQTITDNWGPDVVGSDAAVVPVGKGLLGANWANGSEAIARALEQVNGDLSDGGVAFRAALTQIGEEGFDTVEGPVSLDENRQAIGNNYLIQATELDDGTVVNKTLKTIPDVDQTFSGNFSADTPTPDRENPKCDPSALKVPTWATGG
jgi:branched-chain amino acid transport system substrate-binding protein